MLLRDESKLAEIATEALIDAYYERVNAYREQTLAQAIWIDTADDPTSMARLAVGMKTEEFERKVAKLNSRLRFATLPSKPDKRVCWVERRGEAYPICVYEAEWMPESSLRARHTEVIQNSMNTLVCNGGPVHHHLERADFPKSHWNAEKGEFEFDGLRPHEEEVEVPWSEVKRGYRTVLLYLLEAGELDMDQVERHFGPGTSRGWAVHTGKRTDIEGTPS
jgi:hypothetical protein